MESSLSERTLSRLSFDNESEGLHFRESMQLTSVGRMDEFKGFSLICPFVLTENINKAKVRIPK
jgi:hypothetical protein